MCVSSLVPSYVPPVSGVPVYADVKRPLRIRCVVRVLCEYDVRTQRGRKGVAANVRDARSRQRRRGSCNPT